MKQIAFILLWLVLLLPFTVGAQTDTLGLSAPDALLLAAANSAPLDSFAFDFSFQLAVDLETFTLGADIAGIGAADRDANALNLVEEGDIRLGTAQNIPLDGELRWVNDTFYISKGGWQGLEGASAALASLVSEFTGLSVDAEALSHWDLTGVDGVSDILTKLAAADPSTFISAQRLEDADGAAQFQLTADLHALFDTDAFSEAINTLAHAQGSDLIIHSPAEIAELVRANNAAVDPALLVITQFIGLEDSLLHRVMLNLHMEVAPEAAGFSSMPFTVDMSLDLTLSEHNQPQEISVPEGAPLVPELAIGIAPLGVPEGGDIRYLSFQTLDENVTYSQPIDLQAGDVVTITARRLSLDVDAVLSLVSPGGEVVIENDDNETSAYFASAYDSQISSYSVPESGAYTIEVAELGGLAGSFTLTINVER